MKGWGPKGAKLGREGPFMGRRPISRLQGLAKLARSANFLIVTIKNPHIIVPALGEEGQFARVVTMNNNFMTRSGRKVGAPKKLIYD